MTSLLRVQVIFIQDALKDIIDPYLASYYFFHLHRDEPWVTNTLAVRFRKAEPVPATWQQIVDDYKQRTESD